MNGSSRARRFQELRAAEDQWLALRKKSDAAAVRYWNIRVEQRYPLRPSPMFGQAINGGYPARLPGLRYPLDYVFCTSHFDVVSMQVLPKFGSDHLPLIAAMRLLGQS